MKSFDFTCKFSKTPFYTIAVTKFLCCLASVAHDRVIRQNSYLFLDNHTAQLLHSKHWHVLHLYDTTQENLPLGTGTPRQQEQASPEHHQRESNFVSWQLQ